LCSLDDGAQDVTRLARLEVGRRRVVQDSGYPRASHPFSTESTCRRVHHRRRSMSGRHRCPRPGTGDVLGIAVTRGCPLSLRRSYLAAVRPESAIHCGFLAERVRSRLTKRSRPGIRSRRSTPCSRKPGEKEKSSVNNTPAGSAAASELEGVFVATAEGGLAVRAGLLPTADSRASGNSRGHRASVMPTAVRCCCGGLHCGQRRCRRLLVGSGVPSTVWWVGRYGGLHCGQAAVPWPEPSGATSCG